MQAKTSEDSVSIGLVNLERKRVATKAKPVYT